MCMRYGASHTEVFLPWSQEMEQWCNHLGGKSFGAKLRRLMLAVIMWHLWQEKNRRVFQHTIAT